MRVWQTAHPLRAITLASVVALFVMLAGVGDAKAEPSHGNCTAVGYLCLWTGTNYGGDMTRFNSEGDWALYSRPDAGSYDNYRNKYASWISNSGNPAEFGGWEACLKIYGYHADLTGYVYGKAEGISPGSNAAIRNNVSGVLLSSSRVTCDPGTGPQFYEDAP